MYCLNTLTARHKEGDRVKDLAIMPLKILLLNDLYDMKVIDKEIYDKAAEIFFKESLEEKVIQMPDRMKKSA